MPSGSAGATSKSGAVMSAGTGGARRGFQPLPNGLADSHIALRGNEGGAAFGGLELEPALEHDDGSGLAVVAGPSAEAGADPCRIGERAPGWGLRCRSVLPSRLLHKASMRGRSSEPKASVT